VNAEFRPRVTPGESVLATNRSRSLINMDSTSDDPLLLFTPERPIARTFEIAPMRSSALDPVRDSYVSTANRLFSSIVALSLVVMSLGVGILIGFAGGYVSAPHMNLPSPLRDETPAPPAPPAVVPAAADAVQPTHPANPPVSAEPAVPPRAISEPRPASGGSRAAGNARATVSSPGAAPGSIEVLSRPAGALVAIDGRVVGTTPMTIPDVSTGTHVIGMELAGFSRWATSVRVEAGERARVGASLSEAAASSQ
jgi:PEGA domain-containing protein